MPRLIIVTLLLASCSAPAEPAPQAAHDTLEAGAPAASGSLFDLDMQLTTYGGNPITFARYQGEALLVSMFYATCPAACPLLINKIKQLDKEVGGERLRVILVTFDPERDTLDRLEKLAELHKLDTSRWFLARAHPDDVRTLAAVLGIKYRFTPSGAIHHSSVITALDGQGRIAAQMQDLTVSPDKVLAALRKQTNL